MKELVISEKHLKEIIKILSKNRKIKKAIIYGSCAKGNFNVVSEYEFFRAEADEAHAENCKL